ncbi:MAG: DUF1573 domain-containing protein [Flavobacteriales bacterium]
MKKLILSMGLLFLGAVALKAQSVTPSPASGAEMTFEKEVHDYGTVKQGADGNCEFIFTNTGTTPLVISDARGSCGCTVPTWPKEPIKPGAKSTIKVHYDTKRPGPISKTVTVTANVEGGTKVLRIKGTVEATATTPTNGAPVKTETGVTPKND